MSFGLTYDFRNPPATGRSSGDLYHQTLDCIVDTESLGFDTVWLTEHHFTDDGYLPAMMPMAAAIAQRTSTLRIGTNVLLLPLHHPLRIAEDGAVIDILSNGRFMLGVAVGYRPDEFKILDVSLQDRGRRINEQLGIIAQAWETGMVSLNGDFYHFEQVQVTPRPVQVPRPPIYGGGTSRAALRRAARLCDGLLVPGLGSLQEYEAFAAEVEAAGKDRSQTSYLCTNIVMYLDENHERAWDMVKHHILYQENVYAQWYLDAGYPELVDRRLIANPDDLKRDNYLVGSPDYVLERISRHRETVPHSHMSFWAILPGQEVASARRSLELFASKVLPALS